MENLYKLESDHLAVSLTKPPTQFGVPLVAFYFNCMSCFLGCMLVSSLVQKGIVVVIMFVALFFVAHLAMAWITFRDAFGLTLFWMNFSQFKKHPNFTFWGNTDVFSP